jgi:hypothetical protein
MRLRHLIALTAALAAPVSPSFGWGQTGHRITATIAEQNLSGLARANIELLLGTESLPQAVTWPDDMRSDTSEFWQRTASPWHYVTVPTGVAYGPSLAPAEGDAVTALRQFSQTLRDPNAGLEQKQMALRFIIHIVGDLHQPLHAGRPGDRGGNNFRVTYFGQQTNLHSVWDSGMIDSRGLSYSEYAAWLERMTTAREIVEWSNVDPVVWISESTALRETIYPEDTRLSYAYAFQHGRDLDRRLAQAGIRIAAYLNQLYSS